LVDDNGKPSWSNVIFDLGQPRVGQGSVTFRGNHYVSGGITNPVTNAPTDEVLTTFVNDDLSLNQFPDNTNFLKTEGVLRNPRAYHGMVVVPATSAGDKGTAFVYVIGGRGPDNRVFNDVIVARIGKDEDRNVGFAPDGWFYSKPYRITFLNAEVREIGWSSLITRTNDLNMDIEMEYRVSLDNDCDAATWTLDDWQQLDGTTSDANYRSVNGPNSVPVADEPARCFQYRARLVGGGPTSPQGFPTATPGLLNVSITIVIPGSPDLKVLSVPNDPTKNDIEATFNSNGSFTGLKVAVRNHNDKADTGAEPTLSANEDGSGGSFYVDLWIYKKDQAPGKPTVPFNGAPTGSTACAVVMKSEMTPDRVLPITSWYDSATCSGAPVLPQDVISRLGRGTYVVYVAVDSDCGPNAPHGCVDETSADNGEANNVTEYEFTVNPPEGKPLVSYDSLFPLMFKKP
jgi:hypothetical protein